MLSIAKTPLQPILTLIRHLEEVINEVEFKMLIS